MPTGPKKQADARRARAESQEENFLRRWSRRKDAAPPARAAVPMPERGPAPAREMPLAPILTDRDMPPVESLNEKSDFSGFLSAGVSEALRRRALRKLFHLPQFNERCLLDSEYYDCTNFTPLGNTITHEMREVLEREARRLGDTARRNVLDDDASAQPPSARDEAQPAATPAAVAAPASRRQQPRTRSAAKRRRGHSRS